jgi:plastocyanin
MAVSLVLMLGAVSAAAITGSTPPPAPPFVHIKLPAKGTAPAPTPIVSASAPAAASTGAPAPKLPAGTIALAADPTGVLKFDQTSLTAKTGKVTIAFTNASPIPHDVAVAKGSTLLGKTQTFQGGGTKDLTLHLTPGTYTFYCTVPGHEQAGMQGTLTVQ